MSLDVFKGASFNQKRVQLPLDFGGGVTVILQAGDSNVSICFLYRNSYWILDFSFRTVSGKTIIICLGGILVRNGSPNDHEPLHSNLWSAP